jgi:hypothetical protein
MADQCSFCDERRPAGGTNMLILGPHWIEFCQPCGEVEELTNSVTGKVMTIREIFESGEVCQEHHLEAQSEVRSPGMILG